MRITGNRMIDLAAAATTRTQSESAIAANEVSSGLRVAKPSDDPTAWAAAERARLHRTISVGTVNALDSHRERLDQTESSLATIGDATSRVRELAVQGASAGYNAADRIQLATNIRSVMLGAIGAANSRSGEGEYLLAGSASLTQPFDPTTGAYVGDATTRAIPITEGTNVTSTITGTELTASAGVDVFAVMGRIAAALDANDPATVSASLGDLETATKQIALARSKLGGAMNVLDDTKLAHSQLQENLNREVAYRVEVDTVDAASRLAKASQALEVSRAVSSHVIALLDPR
jgi:flagellar hook-associated protein 3 FlgL